MSPRWPENGFQKPFSELISELRRVLKTDPNWIGLISDASKRRRSVHLAIFVEPYLGYVLDGTKTVESRFSINRCAPWDQVVLGDILLLKQSGGPIVGVCRIGQVWSYQLKAETFAWLQTEFKESLRAQDPAFWKSRSKASYATLMKVESVRSLPTIEYPKRDRRGWVIISSRISSLNNQPIG